MRIVHETQGLATDTGCVVVPTMGALHGGHETLIALARTRGDELGLPVVVTVFVNPTQFDESHDFERYPRTLEADAARAEAGGADIVFAPPREVVYPPDGSVVVPPLPRVTTEPGLEDRYRPGHFEGVCQVCKRLFELTDARIGIFGEKDWQQLRAVSAMCEELGLPVRIEGAPTAREADGLAMSSRNVHLDPAARSQAAAISAAMEAAGRSGSPGEAEAAGLAVLQGAGITPEYFAVREARGLERAPVEGEAARVLVAARVGTTRLIDNAPWPGFTR